MFHGQKAAGFYREQDMKFYAYFMERESYETLELEYCIVIGDPRYLEFVGNLANPTLKRVEEITGVRTQPIIIFVGDGTTMLQHYGDLGISPVPPAQCNACTSYLNTDYFLRQGLDNPATIRAVVHEPAHPAFNLSILDNEGRPSYRADQSWTISEAMAGPLNHEFWNDLQTPKGLTLDFGPLESGEKDLYVWLAEIRARYGLTDVTYFQNWAIAEFYRWASHQGDLAYWYRKALELKP